MPPLANCYIPLACAPAPDRLSAPYETARPTASRFRSLSVFGQVSQTDDRFCDLTTHPLVPMVCVRHSSAFYSMSPSARFTIANSRGIPMGLAASAFAPTAFSDSHTPLTVARLNSDRPSKDSIASAHWVMPKTHPRRPTDLPIDHRLVYRQCHGLAACLSIRHRGSYLPFAFRESLARPSAITCPLVRSSVPITVSARCRNHLKARSTPRLVSNPVHLVLP